MGYNTRFTLTCSDPSVLDEVLNVQTEYGDFSELFERNKNALETYEIKWYDHEKDISKMSKMFPDVIFTLRGDGEESGDIWQKYFLNGKMQVAEAQITFEECKFKVDPNAKKDRERAKRKKQLEEKRQELARLEEQVAQLRAEIDQK